MYRKITYRYHLVRKNKEKKATYIPLNRLTIGKDFLVMAGPCAVESKEMLLETAWCVKENGGHILRGGVFKPRTSPYSFQGLGKKGLEYLSLAREETGLPIITEATTPEDVPLVAEYADIIQVGSRNMQNFRLLATLGKIKHPVFLKRGCWATIDEFLLAAEYICREGNTKVILCERGIRTFEQATRNTLDISAVPLLKELTHLPIVVDPSHATGKSSLVPPLAQAALACGAHGLMVEIHPKPKSALSDGFQSLNFREFGKMMQNLKNLATNLNIPWGNF